MQLRLPINISSSGTVSVGLHICNLHLRNFFFKNMQENMRENEGLNFYQIDRLYPTCRHAMARLTKKFKTFHLNEARTAVDIN